MLQTKKLKKECGTTVKVHLLNLEQLIFTWTGRHLVLALFTSYIIFKNLQKLLKN